MGDSEMTEKSIYHSLSARPNRPVLRYHGGKFMLRDWVISHFPPHQVYVEPYGGAASVFMGKPRVRAEIYNDLDGGIVNVFKVLRDPVMARELERQLRLTPFARTEFDDCYGKLTDDPIEEARRAIVISFMGYGAGTVTRQDKTGFCSRRTDKSFHLPSHDWATYHNAIRAFSDRLQGCVIENRPATWVMEYFDSPETLHYVDPPYVRAARGRTARMDYRYEMNDDQHRELAETLHQLKGMVILSGYPSVLYDEIYGEGWIQRQRITHNVRGVKSRECLWMRNIENGLFT